MGCNFIGIEIEPKYFAIAERRIRAEAAQGKLFT
jgi:DNA modification methylase